jgi:hypothetical protein
MWQDLPRDIRATIGESSPGAEIHTTFLAISRINAVEPGSHGWSVSVGVFRDYLQEEEEEHGTILRLIERFSMDHQIYYDASSMVMFIWGRCCILKYRLDTEFHAIVTAVKNVAVELLNEMGMREVVVRRLGEDTFEQVYRIRYRYPLRYTSLRAVSASDKEAVAGPPSLP